MCESDVNKLPEGIAGADPGVGASFLVNFHSITFDLLLTIQFLRKASQKHATFSVRNTGQPTQISRRRSVDARSSMQLNHRYFRRISHANSVVRSHPYYSR